MGFINYAAKGKEELAKNKSGNVTIENNNTQVDVPIITLDEIIKKVECEYILPPRVASIRGVPRNMELNGIEAAEKGIKYSNYLNESDNEQSMGITV